MDQDGKKLSLLHVHVCPNCGGVFRREEVKGRAHTTGIFICSMCGNEGPLNIEIRELEIAES